MTDRRPGSDQLGLRLDPDRPGPPRSIRPMLPRPAAAAFDDPDHLFEPWWGGERAFAFIDVDATTGAGRVRILDRRGRDRASALPELTGTGGLVGRLGGHAAVLDGTLVVVDGQGRPDPTALAARLADGAGGTVVYLAFDLIALDGRPLVAEPLERRRDQLGRIVEPGGSVLVVPAIPCEGRALHAAATAQGIPATIGRHRRSPYLAGVRSRLWRLVATDPAARGVGQAADAEPTHSSPAPVTTDEPPVPGPTAPILALIQRLPFDPPD